MHKSTSCKSQHGDSRLKSPWCSSQDCPQQSSAFTRLQLQPHLPRARRQPSRPQEKLHPTPVSGSTPPTFKAAATSVPWEKPWPVLGSGCRPSGSSPTTPWEAAANMPQEKSPPGQALAPTPPVHPHPLQALQGDNLGTFCKKPRPVLTSAPAHLRKPLCTHRLHRDPPTQGNSFS